MQKQQVSLPRLLGTETTPPPLHREMHHKLTLAALKDHNELIQQMIVITLGFVKCSLLSFNPLNPSIKVHRGDIAPSESNLSISSSTLDLSVNGSGLGLKTRLSIRIYLNTNLGAFEFSQLISEHFLMLV